MVNAWLDGAPDAATVIGAVTVVVTVTLSGLLFAFRARARSIPALRKGLARSWTSQGEYSWNTHS